MNRTLNIVSNYELDAIVDCFLPEEIDYFCIASSSMKGGGVHHFATITFLKSISSETLAEKLVAFIISNYQEYILQEVLRQNFIKFTNSETQEILKTAQNSMAIFNLVYNKIIIVKNLTEYFKCENKIFIEGFLNFRSNEYRRIAQMVLSDSIEQFFIKKEYGEFIEYLKAYVFELNPCINLIHIKPDLNNNFILYNFKKERIVFEIDNKNPIEIFLIDSDMLLSVLIALAPKRIIWHKDLNNQCSNIQSAISKIFEGRFSLCCGCELCDDNYIE